MTIAEGVQVADHLLATDLAEQQTTPTATSPTRLSIEMAQPTGRKLATAR